MNDPVELYAVMYVEATDLTIALHTIAKESTDPDMVRIAMAALMATEIGKRYIAANPLGY